jgi:CubicO group peptidase (beta-lactamase class C family)
MPFGEYLAAGVLRPLGMGAELRGSAAADLHGTLDDLAAFARELQRPTLIAPETLIEATTVQFPGLAGVLPDFGRFDPLDWGLGFELRDAKDPHWTGTRASPRTFGHFGGSGTFVWVDPEVDVALGVLTDREFDEWAKEAWPELSDAVLGEER